MNDQPTQFFCLCGRLLTVEGSIAELTCPTCSRQLSVPHAHGTTTSFGTQLLTPQAGTQVADYRIEAALGHGGMGSVYRAVDVRDGEPVALKVLHPSLQARPDFVSRFRREARAAAGLDHDNVVRVLDYGIGEIGPWIAMELIEGSDLMTVAPRLDEAQRVHIMKQAACGLRAAASAGITHRDVKPTNLLLLEDGSLKIADFGLAKASDTESNLTMTGEVLGTPHYMSPEQGRGQRVDYRSDLYSLGATFYHLACGDPPFTADTPVAVIMRHVSDTPEPLRRRSSHTSAGFEAVVHRLLQKAPSDRYASYDQLLEDLRRLELGKDPLHGAPPPEKVIQDGNKTFVLPREAQTELILKPAAVGARGIAMLLDLVLLELGFLALGALWTAFLASGPRRFDDLPPFWNALSGDPARLEPIFSLLILLLPVLYFVSSDSRGGRSFGKGRAGLRVCRTDGENAGPAAALMRLALLLPGLLLLSPSLSTAALSLVGPDHWRQTSLGDSSDVHGKLRFLGGCYLLVLSILGRLSGAGIPLHDALSGTRVWRARRATAARKDRPTLYRPPSPMIAFWLAAFPGGGLLYAGQLGLGMLAMVAIPALLVSAAWQTVVAAWALSAVLSSHFAHRRGDAMRAESAAELEDRTKVLRRQES